MEEIEWYKSLTLHQKINVKSECFELLLGVPFEELGRLFSFKERMNIFYNKAKMEGLL